jgi:hypothetical protein
MRGPRPVWLVAALGAALLAVAVGAHALEGLGGTLATGEAHYVEVVQVDGSGVLAGLVTETDEGPLGLTSDTTPKTSGWVVAHPPSVDVQEGQEVQVTEEIPFEDPNGGTWTERRVQIGNATAWAVPVDHARQDPTLEAAYNFALVVDWDQVPQEEDLVTTYVDELALAE